MAVPRKKYIPVSESKEKSPAIKSNYNGSRSRTFFNVFNLFKPWNIQFILPRSKIISEITREVLVASDTDSVPNLLLCWLPCPNFHGPAGAGALSVPTIMNSFADWQASL